MKTSKAILCGTMLLGHVLLSTTPASAHTVRARPASGVVETLDVANHSVKFSAKNGKAPTSLALTSRTEFIHNGHFAAPDELKDGTKAVVYYRTPFFGKPFVTRIVWFNGA